MRILVTGGSGFVGSHLIRKLAADGHHLFALARSEASDGTLRDLGATPLRGDLDSRTQPSLPKLDSVVHAAAYFRFAGPRKPYFRTNVAGTQKLIKAARDAGAQSFVYVSAAAVVMDDRGTPFRNADESAPTYPRSFSGYIASKAQGEALVLAADRPGFRTIAIRPPAIWGPGDAFSKALPEAIGTGRFAFINGGEYAFATCHVDNLIEAISAAIVRGTGGRAYFVQDPDTISFREFVSDLAHLQGLSIDGLRSIPYGAASMVARLLELGAAITRSDRDPPLSRTLVRLMGREFSINDSAARTELGYASQLSRAQGLATYAS